MSFNKLKKYIVFLILAVNVLAFLLPRFSNVQYLAETISSSDDESMIIESSKKSVGHKIENAEYWDYNENYDKARIWIDTGSGGNGKGGGAGDGSSSDSGNGGTGDEKGGVFGNSAGKGLGTGNNKNQSGIGGSNSGEGDGAGFSSGSTNSGQDGDYGNSNVRISGGSSGSAISDALRSLKQDIDESRAESYAKEMETAINQSIVASSIAERESIQASIQKKLAQESVKARIAPKEYDMIPDPSLYATTKKMFETYRETVAPTFVETSRIYETTRFNDRLVPTAEFDNRRKNINITQNTKVETYKAMQGTMPITQAVKEPTSEYVETEPLIVEEEINYSDFEPGDFIETTVNNLPTIQTLDVKEETFEPTMEQEVVYDNEIVIPSSEDMSNAKEESSIESQIESTEQNKEDTEEEGSGSKGGEDSEAEENKKGDDSSDESEGNASDKGQYHEEEKNEFAGKKIFELDKNGNIGLENDHYSMIKMRDLIFAIAVILFLIGGLVFIFTSRDKKNKHNYF